jgi:hypothetical protein
MTQERMLYLATKCVAEAIKDAGYVEYALFTLQDKETDITRNDLADFGWKYIIVDEQRGSFARIHLLAGYDNYDNAVNFFNHFNKDIEMKMVTGCKVVINSTNYRYQYHCPHDMRKPIQQTVKKSDETNIWQKAIISERRWEEWSRKIDGFSEPFIQGHHRYCLIDLEKVYTA